ncbi:hypothetical protein SAMN04487906_1776 [Zhouia amylolytica]|uniref:DUF1611 domain-containing protein n=1 Tax=Zhouia amylolytica TaxID=376730 RepID=A0A1I6T1H0_9FLAO|nr:hypothetical protein [Zhouia amylolytica]SFS82918.1 hypothetical protein SAMN04487906_1776 [Zhouia amylolytica]
MNSTHIYTSLTRISDLSEKNYSVTKLNKDPWETGDYVACKIIDIGKPSAQLELTNGRMRGVMGGEVLIGALGLRHATLEATGSWKEVTDDGIMHVLTSGGLLGKLTSRSMFMSALITMEYLGHLSRNHHKIVMNDFIKPVSTKEFNIPVVLFTGTSMSAGKTTSARIVTKIFKENGLKVLGAKIAGAGRYKDILAIKDVGADTIIDFVDAGLPSSICGSGLFKDKMNYLKSRMSHENPDVAVIEIGASPLEPYNGEIAFQAIKKHVKCNILSASDPYAVYGLMKAFNMKPDIVTGISTNTLGGRELVENLCDVTALNLMDPNTQPDLKRILNNLLELNLK